MDPPNGMRAAKNVKRKNSLGVFGDQNGQIFAFMKLISGKRSLGLFEETKFHEN